MGATGHLGVRSSLQEMALCEQEGRGCSPRSREVSLKSESTCGVHRVAVCTGRPCAQGGHVHRVADSDMARATSSLSQEDMRSAQGGHVHRVANSDMA